MKLETEPDFFFDFFLAEKLRLTLSEVRDMPAEEWSQWAIYFAKKAQQQQMNGG